MTGIIKHSGTLTSQIAVGRVDQRNCNYGYLSVHAYEYLGLNKYCHSAAYIEMSHFVYKACYSSTDVLFYDCTF